ncbi:hypothetical protein CRG98_047216 [Punica granatum]|nr:hypothetical protein CRG98_047216 [Punica granatum]
MASITGAVKLSKPAIAPSSNLTSLHKMDFKYEQLNGVQQRRTLLITSGWERRDTIDKRISSYPISNRKLALSQRPLHCTELQATLKSPRGFSPTPKNPKRTKKSDRGSSIDDEEDDPDDDPSAGIIPEVVTNRMMNRMAFSVGIPLFIGLLFFPFFYYLKVGLKIDVPTWVPFIVSFFFFGSALLGVSYGIVSSSWDPMREGSLLGWNEAQKNWPIFWQSLWGRSGKK